MNLRQLQYFYDTALYENLAKTAEKHTVPASSVSASIKRLENELGIKLFDRTANKIRLNANGKILAGELHTAFDRIDTTIRQLSAADTQCPEIKILIRARPKWITDIIVAYKATRPNVNFVISNDYMAENLTDFDLIIDEDSEKYRNWHRFLLSIEVICVKAAADSELVGKKLSFAHLKDQPFILASKGNGMRRLYEETCKRYGFKPNVVVECNDRQCLQCYVQAGMGLTLGAYRALQDNTQDQIAALTVSDFHEVQSVYVFHRDSDTHNVYLKDFCDFLCTYRNV